jgi:hypothetical protein
VLQIHDNHSFAQPRRKSEKDFRIKAVCFTNAQPSYLRFGEISVDVKLVLIGITPIFITLCLIFGTKNGFYDTDSYHGNGSAHSS